MTARQAMIEPGQLVAGFRIVHAVDDRGAGAVYEAVHEDLGGPVALKLFRSGLSEDPTFRGRFRHLFTCLATLEHVHLVPVYETGQSEQGLYVAMRLVQGRSLQEVMSSGPLDPHAAVALGAQIAAALDAAHGAGVLHRDLTPRKILVEDDPRLALLTGFAVREVPSDPPANGGARAHPPYTSPEQLAGEPGTRLSDLYALAEVLREALHGTPPGPPSQGGEGMGPLQSDGDRRADLPAALDAVFERALAHDPRERQRSAGELVDELAVALSETAGAQDAPAPVHLESGASPPDVTAGPQAEAARPSDAVEGRHRGARRREQSATRSPVPTPRSHATPVPPRAARDRTKLLAILLLLAWSGVLGWSLSGARAPLAQPPSGPASPAASGPDGARFAASLETAVERLNPRRARLERRMRAARTARGQAGTARSLARSYRSAASAVDARAASAGNRAAARAVVAQLERTAAAYGEMSRAAARRDARGFRAAARRARRREQQLRGQLERLSNAPRLASAEP